MSGQRKEGRAAQAVDIHSNVDLVAVHCLLGRQEIHSPQYLLVVLKRQGVLFTLIEELR